jgi:two-component system NtrC family sensor kinase
VAELRGGLTGQASLSLCDKYLGIADKLVLNTKSEAVLLGLVQDTAKEMQRVIEKVAGREREVIGAYLVSSQRLLLGALFLLVMLGPLTMWFIAKAISSPLRNLEATARKITEGELDLRVETKGDVETRSLQRSINAMLDRLRLSRESIEETVRLLQEKNAQLIESEKLASIGVLASGVAHEINNPLANISLTAETILDAGKDIPEEELKRLTKDIIEQTERAQAVVVNLLGYARAQKDERWEDVEVGEALARSLRLISHHIALHDVTLNDESGGPPLIVKGNRGKLEQVFVNIMVNALHAMEKGGTLTLRVHPDETGGYALIEFKDTGPGILLDNLQKVFDPFYTTKSMGEGTGLGLYVSYGIVRDHGGDIEVESIPGAGALFRVMLPILKA